MNVTFISAANAGYFHLLDGLVRSLAQYRREHGIDFCVLDLGLSEDQVQALKSHGVSTIVKPDWDVDFRGRGHAPEYFKAMTSRPHIPKHIPGYDIYFYLDADTWIQDSRVLDLYLRPAQKGTIALTPEVDRSYWTLYKRPRLWGQNQKTFAWGYGLNAGYRLGRNPILNSGVFALHRDAPHWDAWAKAHARALRRFRLRAAHTNRMAFFLSEQTALNYIVFKEQLPTTFLPAYCNWFCGKGTPMYDPDQKLLIEPNEPHLPLGIVHLAGDGMKERVFSMGTPSGGTVESLLTYDAVGKLTDRPA